MQTPTVMSPSTSTGKTASNSYSQEWESPYPGGADFPAAPIPESEEEGALVSPLDRTRKAIATAMGQGYPITPIPESLKPRTAKENLKNYLLGMIPFYGPARTQADYEKRAYDAQVFEMEKLADEREWQRAKGYQDKTFDAIIDVQKETAKQQEKLMMLDILYPNAPRSMKLDIIGVKQPSSDTIQSEPHKIIPIGPNGEVYEGRPIPAVFHPVMKTWAYRDPWTNQLVTNDISKIADYQIGNSPASNRTNPVNWDVISDEQGMQFERNPETGDVRPLMYQGNQLKKRIEPKTYPLVTLKDASTGQDTVYERRPEGLVPVQKAGGGGVLPKATESDKKMWDEALTADEVLSRMIANRRSAEKENNAQSDVSLLFDHMSMTLGKVKGARLNQAEIDRAISARPWLESIYATYKKGVKGPFLSPEQRRFMVDLAIRVRNEAWIKARRKAEANNLPMTGYPTMRPDLPAIQESVGPTSDQVTIITPAGKERTIKRSDLPTALSLGAKEKKEGAK